MKGLAKHELAIEGECKIQDLDCGNMHLLRLSSLNVAGNCWQAS